MQNDLSDRLPKDDAELMYSMYRLRQMVVTGTTDFYEILPDDSWVAYHRLTQDQKEVVMDRLSERAILVRVKECFNGVYKYDQKARNDLADMAKGERTAFSATKRKWPEHAIEGMRQKISALRAMHRKMTLPWNDVGYRLLPNDKFFEFITEVSRIKDSFYYERQIFKDHFPQYVEEGLKAQGDYADPTSYPKAAEEVDNLFDLSIVVRPCPNSNDIRVDLPVDLLDNLKRMADSHLEENVTAAVKELWLRFAKVVSHMTTKLNTGDPKYFHSSLLDNVEEMLKIIPSYNLTNDPQLEESRKEVERVINGINSIDDIKDNEQLRRDTVEKLSKLMDKFPEVD